MNDTKITITYVDKSTEVIMCESWDKTDKVLLLNVQKKADDYKQVYIERHQIRKMEVE